MVLSFTSAASPGSWVFRESTYSWISARICSVVSPGRSRLKKEAVQESATVWILVPPVIIPKLMTGWPKKGWVLSS